MHSPIALFWICGPLSLDHTLNRYYVGGNMQIWRFNALQMLNTVYIYIKKQASAYKGLSQVLHFAIVHAKGSNNCKRIHKSLSDTSSPSQALLHMYTPYRLHLHVSWLSVCALNTTCNHICISHIHRIHALRVCSSLFIHLNCVCGCGETGLTLESR